MTYISVPSLRDPNKIQAARTDNGGEFTSQNFISHLQASGTLIERSCAQEGHSYIAERSIRTVKELALANLKQAALPYGFIGDAICTTPPQTFLWIFDKVCTKEPPHSRELCLSAPSLHRHRPWSLVLVRESLPGHEAVDPPCGPAPWFLSYSLH